MNLPCARVSGRGLFSLSESIRYVVRYHIMQSSAENHQDSILFCVHCAPYTLALIDLVHTNDLLAPAPTGSGMQQLFGKPSPRPE